MKVSQQFRYTLITGFIAANVAIISISGISLYQSKLEHELRAQNTAKNTAAALDRSISNSIARIDLSLNAIVDELESQLRANQQISQDKLALLLDKYHARLPELEGLRIADAAGDVFLGKGVGNTRVSWADREYFAYHQTHNDNSIQMTKPQMGRVAKVPVIGFSRRYDFPDRQFAGVISATISVSYFTQLLSQFDLGPKGTLILRNNDFGLVTRFPEITDQPSGEIGNTTISDELRNLVKSDVPLAAYHIHNAPDGFERINAFQKLSGVPFIVIAGLASDDYLQNWRIELRKSIGIYLAFLITSSIGLAFLIRLLTQSEKNIQLLRNNEDRLEEAQKLAKLGSWSLNIESGKLYWSHGVFQLFEIDETQFEATYEAFLNAIHPEDRDAVNAAYNKSLENQTPYEITHRLLMPDGRIKWVQERCRTEFNENGAPIKSSGTIQEVTDQVKIEEQLRIAAVSFNSQEAIVVTDANSIILNVNQAFTKITGYSPEEIIGQTPQILKSDRHSPEFYQTMWQSITQTGSWQGEIWDKRKNGEEYPKWLTISAVRNKQGTITHYVGTHFDITERKRDEEKIRQLAYIDQLTGLANRTTLYSRLDHLLSLMERKNSQLALMMIDLDNFKSINDTLGHQTGDELLIEVSQRLSASVRHSDLVARLGGDEFIIVLPDIDSASDAAHVADKIVNTVSAPYLLQGKEVRTGPSIGICLYPDDAQEMDDIIKKADTAMYHAKSNGRGHYQFFRTEIQRDAENRLAIEADLRSAITKREFILYYQPQLDLRTGNIIGVEALIRWQHPTKGMISPLDFIPIAEETGLILPIGDWVLQEACEQMLRWKSNGISSIKVSVNLTASQFLNASLPDRIQALMEQYDIPPHLLNLEVTESMSMKFPDQTIATMKELTSHGLGLSIDDFGTGYSSLSYLKLFPVSTLKIDRSFVKDIETDENDAIICDVTVLLAHKLGMDVVAEGVETQEQLKYLRSIGCEKIQGYLISKPLPAEQVEFLLKSNLHFVDEGSVDLWGENS